MRHAIPLAALAALALAACQPLAPVDSGPPPEAGQIRVYQDTRPDGHSADQCWGQQPLPARYELVSAPVKVVEAQYTADGTLLHPPIYRNLTQKKQVGPDRALWFETPCPATVTPDFVASLQRALRARGLYSGPDSGTLDARTRYAVREFQSPLGLDSETLSLDAARLLGLAAYGAPGG